MVEQYGLEKIKTSGDCYLVVSGGPDPRPDHLEAMACLALEMGDAIAGLKDEVGQGVPIRIGMGAGPVVAGVVGTRRFFYDVWGDAVNVASRVESTGMQGRIQVPQEVYERLENSFVFEPRARSRAKARASCGPGSSRPSATTLHYMKRVPTRRRNPMRNVIPR